MTKEYDKDVLEKWDYIKREAPKINGALDVDMDNLPDWLDKDKYIKIAQPNNQRLMPMNIMSSLTGLAFLVQIPDIFHPLCYTGKSKSVCSLFHRYLDTGLHCSRWFETNIFDKESAGYKSLRSVHAMHKHVNKMVNRACIDKNPKADQGHVWVNQYDMIITEWAFFGLQILQPVACGGHNVTNEELEILIYSWRCIFYLLGIRDDFTICMSTYEKTRQLCELIWLEVYKPILNAKEHPLPESKGMAMDIFKGQAIVMGSLIDGKVFNQYWYEILDIDQREQLSLMQRFKLNLAKFVVGTAYKSPFIFNAMGKRMRANIAKNEKPKRRKNLNKKVDKEKYKVVKYPFDAEVFTKLAEPINNP